MNYLNYFFLSVLFIQTANVFSQKQQDLAALVNPFVGTGGHGHTYPGATLPFGMIQLSPDTRLTGWDGCSGYHYSDSVVYGFSHTHLSGTGCSDYGDILLMPTVGTVSFRNDEYASEFSRKDEKASPGYYRTYLKKHKTEVELTTTLRAGIHAYHFPKTKNANIIIDLEHRDEVIDSYLQIVGNTEIHGMRRSKAWAKDQVVYFVIKFSQPFMSFGLSDKNIIQLGKAELSGKKIKAFVSFKSNGKEPIYAKIAISAVGIDGANRNLAAEIPNWDFEKVKQDARKAWNTELNKIQIEGGTIEQQRTFYTALYHTMLAPNLYMDIDKRYRGRDSLVHNADNHSQYTVFSLWDTYRAAHPLYTIIDKARTNDFINTFLNQYKEANLLPVWELSANETDCMIGYHSVSVIADAYMKGIRNFDTELALEAMKHSARQTRYGLEAYQTQGHIPFDDDHESVSKTLEYAYDDWCIAQMAKSMNKTQDYNEFIKRAQYYKNLFDNKTLFMRAKQNGSWFKPFNPAEVNFNYTEANAWQYAFYVPQDIEGLAELMGGKDVMLNHLDDFFKDSTGVQGREQADITGLVGQYAHGNEPSHHAAYLYNYLGMPWKTQERVRQIMNDFYTDKPDGLCGNEDCGQMSAWYVMSAMGFYQVCPGSNQYMIGSPLFSKITIHLENGKEFTIRSNANAQNKYIQLASLNSETLNRSYFTHQELEDGGELSFIMDSQPHPEWASDESNQPRSNIKDRLIMPVPTIEAAGKVFKDKLTVEMTSIVPNAQIYYTLDGKTPTILSKLYTQPFEIDQNTTIKAIAYKLEKGVSFAVQADFYKIPTDKSITIYSRYSRQYTAGGDDGLIDGLRGNANFRLGGWQGYQAQDFEAVIDLQSIKPVNFVSAGFLQDVGSWILMPTEVVYEASTDGTNYTEIARVKNKVSDREYKVVLRDFEAEVNTQARYIRVKAKNYGELPEWHLGAGGDAFIFVDEIMVR